ncbi:hypothetical protein CK203_045555 [Vitis vinifera]|uniref:DUF4219 domain-containing protein n=1 Tax=Vitis vinifera TaxID=29760 RepID=A0A438HLL9_VITVI|nr:hypothetical protein CK203_086317 [Vitis vinifera]RVW85299.1 hypothetical protein CK203_045555 [Vitis vinifera]
MQKKEQTNPLMGSGLPFIRGQHHYHQYAALSTPQSLPKDPDDDDFGPMGGVVLGDYRLLKMKAIWALSGSSDGISEDFDGGRCGLLMGAKSLALIGIVPEELTEENYENWKACLRNYLIGQGLWDVVSGVDPKPGEKGETEAFETWRKKNAMALHAIQMSCGSHALVNIRETDSAKFAWDHLVELRHHRTQHSPPLVQHPKSDQGNSSPQ